MRNTLLCILGRTSSGKDTLAKKIAEFFGDVNILVSYTTRPKRDYETDGVDHYFISEEEYLDKYADKEKLAYTEINGYRYFTLKENVSLSKKTLYIIDPAGLKDIYANKDGSFHVRTIYVKASDDTRRERYNSREETISVPFDERNKKESEQFDQFDADIKNKQIKIDLDVYTDDSGKNKLYLFGDEFLSDVYYMLKSEGNNN